MDGGRMASSAEDGHIVIMELFSKTTVTTIKVPDGITCMTYHDNRLYAGTVSGVIVSIDLDAYAMLETENRGGTLSQAERQRQQEFLTTQEKVFGLPKEEEGASTRLYRSDWIGHEGSVTSIAFLVEGHEERLISGDERGDVRIWDVESRTCLKLLQPWSNTSGGATASAKKDDAATSNSAGSKHPISSILIILQPHEGTSGSGEMFGSSAASHQKRQAALATLVPPLQRFPHEQQSSDPQSSLMAIPFLKPNRSPESFKFWEAQTMTRKRKRDDGTTLRTSTDGSSEAAMALEEAREQVAQLERQLAAKSEEVVRWEKVNNKLMDKLKAKS
jgi:WD40 repeat protein